MESLIDTGWRRDKRLIKTNVRAGCSVFGCVEEIQPCLPNNLLSISNTAAGDSLMVTDPCNLLQKPRNKECIWPPKKCKLSPHWFHLLHMVPLIAGLLRDVDTDPLLVPGRWTRCQQGLRKPSHGTVPSVVVSTAPIKSNRCAGPSRGKLSSKSRVKLE